MARKNMKKKSLVLVVAVSAVTVIVGCGGELQDPAPEQAYWNKDAPPQIVQIDRAPTGRLGLRRERTQRMAPAAEPTAPPDPKEPDANPLPGRTLAKSHPDFALDGDPELESAIQRLSGTHAYEQDNVNLDVRPTLAEGFAQRAVESGMWFGIGQMLGGGPVSVAIFVARHAD